MANKKTYTPRRIRKVLSVTVHPKALAALDGRAEALGISRSRMIERLALAHCTDGIDHAQIDLRVRYVPGQGFEVERGRDVETDLAV